MKPVKKKNEHLQLTLTFDAAEALFIEDKSKRQGTTPGEYVHNAALNTGRKRFRDKIICSVANDLQGYLSALRLDVQKLSDDKQILKNLDELQKGITKLCLL